MAAVSQDLFAERVLIERKAFMEAQAEALLAERQKLIEEGWAEVVIGPQADVQDRLWSMAEAPQEYDDATTAKFKKLADKRGKLEGKVGGTGRGNDPEARSRRSKPSWKRWTTRNRRLPKRRAFIMPRRPRRLARPSFYWTPMDGFGVEYRIPADPFDRIGQWERWQRSGRKWTTDRRSRRLRTT